MMMVDGYCPQGTIKTKTIWEDTPTCEMGQTSLSWDQFMSIAGEPIFILFTVIFFFISKFSKMNLYHF